MGLRNKDLLSIHDLTVGEVATILDVAKKLKRKQKAGEPHQYLKGKTLAMLFSKASTRTRTSFEVGFWQLGGHPIYLSDSASQIGRGEPIRDTARVLSRMVDGIMIRTFSHESVVELADEDVCAVLLEPIQGEGGVHVPSDEYLQQVSALCDKYDALLIFDEVQTGVARTGKWFGYMHSGVKPDVLTFAKGIGGGFPVAGFAVTERLARVFKPGDHGGTFGGNPLACAAVYATLATIKSEGLVEKVAQKGEYFMVELKKLQAKYPALVKEVRGRGLILGMELTSEGRPVVEHCLANGVIVNCTAGSVIRIVPPLIISEEEIDMVVAALDKALAAM